MGGTQFERHDHVDGIYALFGRISAQRSRKSNLLTKVSPNQFFEKDKEKTKTPAYAGKTGRKAVQKTKFNPKRSHKAQR